MTLNFDSERMNKKLLIDDLRRTKAFLDESRILQESEEKILEFFRMNKNNEKRFTLIVKLVEKVRIETKNRRAYALLKCVFNEGPKEIFLVIGHIKLSEVMIALLNFDFYIFSEMKIGLLRSRKILVFQNSRNTRCKLHTTSKPMF